MKKFFALTTVVLLAFALSGCAAQTSKESKSEMSASDTSASLASSSQSQSASASSASASASTSASASASVTSTDGSWAPVKSANKAAEGAGISDFDVPKRAVIADRVFTHPTFGYAEHIVQATYGVDGKAKLTIRNAEGAHTLPLSDYNADSFGHSWKGNYAGYEVTSYGDVKGNATMCHWQNGSEKYGVTIEGLDGKDITMDDEDIDDIVRAVMVEESPQDSDSDQSSDDGDSTSDADENTGNMSDIDPDFDVDAVVSENSLGTFLRYYYVKGTDGTDYWAIVTRGADGGEVTTYTNAEGKVIKGGFDPDYDGADFDVEALAENNGLGDFKRYYWIQGEDGKGYWGIVTTDADNKEHTTYVDEQGNIMQRDVEVGSTTGNADADFDVEAVVNSNNLGQLEHYYWIQDSGDTGYWAIVTRTDDGAECTTYTDEQGNIIQGGL